MTSISTYTSPYMASTVPMSFIPTLATPTSFIPTLATPTPTVSTTTSNAAGPSIFVLDSEERYQTIQVTATPDVAFQAQAKSCMSNPTRKYVTGLLAESAKDASGKKLESVRQAAWTATTGDDTDQGRNKRYLAVIAENLQKLRKTQDWSVEDRKQITFDVRALLSYLDGEQGHPGYVLTGEKWDMYKTKPDNDTGALVSSFAGPEDSSSGASAPIPLLGVKVPGWAKGLFGGQ